MVGGLNPVDEIMRLELHSCDFCPFYNQSHVIETLDFVQSVLHGAESTQIIYYHTPLHHCFLHTSPVVRVKTVK